MYIRLGYIGKKLTMLQDSYCWFGTFQLEMHVTGLKRASENLICLLEVMKIQVNCTKNVEDPDLKPPF